MLRSLAEAARKDEEMILAVAARETGLTRVRLRREFVRMVRTLELFADLVNEGSWVRAAIDHRGQPDPIGPDHDVRKMLVPLGPVAVFGASNFPLAYGVLGGDTASALAAGCPVVVKGHPLHPATGELLATIVYRVVRDYATSDDHLSLLGAFSFLHSGGTTEHEVGRLLVEHHRIQAVGFTGSYAGGKALIDIAKKRDWPIPVFAEMGSNNIVVIAPFAGRNRAEAIADELATSILESAGQQCTRPGTVFIEGGDVTTRFCDALKKRFDAWRQRAMLGTCIAEQYHAAIREDHRCSHVSARRERAPDESPIARPAIIYLSRVGDWEYWPEMRREIFGPAVVVVSSGDGQPARELWEYHTGPWGTIECYSERSLATSIYLDPEDLEALRELDASKWSNRLPLQELIERLSGRLVFNSPPTGVRVATGMVHGGPWPATNRPDTTAVGPLAIERWCRPVCYQNCPDALLPPELRDGNPLGILRVVDGVAGRE